MLFTDSKSVNAITLPAKHLSNVCLLNYFVGRSSDKTNVYGLPSTSQSTLQVMVIQCSLYQKKFARQKSLSFNQSISMTYIQHALTSLGLLPGSSTYTHDKDNTAIATPPSQSVLHQMVQKGSQTTWDREGIIWQIL